MKKFLRRLAKSKWLNLSTSIWNLRIYWALCGVATGFFLVLAMMNGLIYLLTGEWFWLPPMMAWLLDSSLWVYNAYGSARARRSYLDLERAEAYLAKLERQMHERYPATEWYGREH